MRLIYDLQSGRVLSRCDDRTRKRVIVSLAEGIRMIQEAQRSPLPSWKRFYISHYEAELARRRAWRAHSREWIAEYNRNYQLNRKRQREIAAREVDVTKEGAPCCSE